MRVLASRVLLSNEQGSRSTARPQFFTSAWRHRLHWVPFNGSYSAKLLVCTHASLVISTMFPRPCSDSYSARANLPHSSANGLRQPGTGHTIIAGVAYLTINMRRETHKQLTLNIIYYLLKVYLTPNLMYAGMSESRIIAVIII